MKIDLLDPVVEAAPGETAVCRVRVLNDTTGPSAYRLRLLGLNDHEFEYPLGFEPLPAGTEASFDVGIMVPSSFAAGRHALAVEVRSDRRGEQPALAGVTVEVSSIRKVAMRVNPSTIVGRTKGRFDVEIDNREGRPIDLSLRGEGPDLEVALGADRVQLRPGDTIAIPGAVRGRRRLVRDPIHHVMTIVAESNSAPVYADASFDQRPLFPRRLRIGLAFLALLGLWAAILGGGAYWWTHRNDKTTTEEAVDANHDGVPDAPLGSLPTDTTASGASGGAGGQTGTASGGAAGQGQGGGSGAAAGAQSKPTSTVIRGTVKAAETGENQGVTVSLVPATLGGEQRTEADQATLDRGNPGASRPVKIWTARYNRAITPGVSDKVQTESIVTQASDDKGGWVFNDVAIPDTYEVSFAKEGFDTKAFIITPPEDGKAVQLDVALDTAKGGASGTVFGPNGPLGGVDIVITDGELTFNAKSSSQAGDVGRWNVTGLSTPNTYTLTASVRGYGTEVVQVKLNPGQNRSGINITMHPGVGSISGHVLSNASPLGGVTITASSGDLTRTTTSLTLGDEGSYSLPQLTIPGTYTLTAEAPGYVSQSREVTLAGNATDVDFTLIRTTGTITGLVRSDVNGNLEGVGITVRRDDLFFTASTAANGTFTIEQLPPGQYLVSLTRFDHADASQLVTVAAGEVKDLGVITMTFRPRPPLAETGKLIVDVFDSGTTGLPGATVSLLKASDGSLVRSASDPGTGQSSFSFENVPIGTYSIRVTKDGYRTAARPVSMGLSEIRTELHLLQKGQVSFQLFDSTTMNDPKPKQLGDFFAAIYSLKTDGTRIEPPVEVARALPPDPDGNIFWESKPSSLLEGTYEIVISQPPAGYRVLPQMLDPDPTVPAVPANFMKFTIGANEQGAMKLLPLLANPFPRLMGVISAPKLETDGSVSFTPIQQGTVSLTCSGGSTQTVNIDPASGLYVFDSAAVQTAIDKGKQCVVAVDVTAPAGVPHVEINYTNAFEPGGTTPNDLVLNIPVTKAPAPIGGKVFWIDGSDPNPATKIHPIGTVKVNTSGIVITGFQPSSSGSDPVPITTSNPIPGTVIAGTWSLVGQVFGKATYVFTATAGEFLEGQLSVTIDESGSRVVQSINNAVVADNAGSIDVELKPMPGSILGTVNIDSVQPVKQYDQVRVRASGPNGPIADVVPNATNGTYSIPAEAGTWSLTFQPPAGHDFALNAPSSVIKTVQPLQTVGNVDTRLVERGSLSVTVLDAEGQPISVGTPAVVPTVTLSRVATADAGDPGAAAGTPITLNASGVGTASNLPVNTRDGVNVPAQYRLTVSMPGYDNENADIVVGTIHNPSHVTSGLAVDVAVEVLAGEHTTLTVKLPKYGALLGSVQGLIGTTLADPIENLPYAPPLTVTATRVATLGGQTPPTNPTVLVEPVGNSFRITGPPGIYTITVDHPHYLQPPFSSPVDPDTTLPAGQFRLTNKPLGSPNAPPIALASPFILRIAPGFAQVTAVDGLDLPIIGATVTITRGTFTQTLSTVAGGVARFSNLTPGDYDVEIRSRAADAVTDVRFPIMVRVTVPRGDRNDDAARTVNLRGKLLGLDAKISGKVGAFNTAGRPVQLPVDATINRTLVSSSTATENGAATPNTATEANLSSQPSTAEPAGRDPALTPVDPRSFSFANLPQGVHHFTLTDELGYNTPTVSDVLVSAATPEFAFPAPNAQNASSIFYTAKNLTVDVVVRSGSSTGALLTTGVTVELTTPAFPPAQGTLLTAGSPATGVTATYFNVIPETSNYQLKVTAPLHATSDQGVSIGVVDDGTEHATITVVLTPNAAKVTGTAQRQNDEASPPSIEALPAVGTVRLLNFSGGQVATTTPDGQGKYTFDNLPTAGQYRIEVHDTHYTTETSTPFQVDLGIVTTAPTVTIKKLAVMTITLTPLNATATVDGTDRTADCVDGATTSICTFIDLQPGVLHTFAFDATSSNYNPQSVTWTPPIGGIDSRTVALTQRTVTVTVTTEGSSTDSQTATVSLEVPVGTDLGSPTHTAGTSTYSWTAVPFAAGQVTASQTNYRTQTVALGPNPASSVTVNLLKLVTVTGHVTGPPGGNPNGAAITATNTVTNEVKTGTYTNGSDNYSVSGLGIGTWVVRAATAGVGEGFSSQIVVTSTSPSTVANQNITQLPMVTFTFTVTSTPKNGVQVTLGGFSGTSSAAGTATIQLFPSQVPSPLNWTATQTGKRTAHGTIASGGTTADIAMPDPITGTAQISGTGQPGATVRLCTAAASDTECDATPIATAPSSGSTGTFTFATADPAPGDYRIRATFTNTATPPVSFAGSTNITIGASGAITSPSGAITVPMS